MRVGDEIASFFEFDVALTASDAQSVALVLRWQRASWGNFGGDLKTENSTISRIK
jgi:hypothetical protein